MIITMIIAVDVGGTKTLINGFDPEDSTPKPIFELKQPTPKEFADFKQFVLDTAKKHTEHISALSFAMPGIVRKGFVQKFGHLDWGQINIIEEFTPHAQKVFVENDAALGALGEAHAAGNEYSRVLYVTLSTGVGVGFIVDKNPDSLVASEGGHMQIVRKGHDVDWETYAAGSALYRRFGEYAEDMTNNENWQAYAKEVAEGMIQLEAIFVPDVIVLGGPVGEQLHKFKKYLVEELDHWNDEEYLEIPEIVPASEPHRAVINGCFYAAIND